MRLFIGPGADVPLMELVSLYLAGLMSLTGTDIPLPGGLPGGAGVPLPIGAGVRTLNPVGLVSLYPVGLVPVGQLLVSLSMVTGDLLWCTTGYTAW